MPNDIKRDPQFLTRRAFGQVVERTDDDESVRARINTHTDVAEVCHLHVLGVGQRLRDADEWFVAVEFAVSRQRIASAHHIQIDGADDAAIERDEMWREGNRHALASEQRQLLLNFAEVAMLRDAVGARALIAFGEKKFIRDLAPRAAHAAHAADNDAGGLRQAVLQCGRDAEKNTGRVTAGTGDETGFANLVAMKFRQTVHRLFQ